MRIALHCFALHCIIDISIIKLIPAGGFDSFEYQVPNNTMPENPTVEDDPTATTAAAKGDEGGFSPHSTTTTTTSSTPTGSSSKRNKAAAVAAAAMMTTTVLEQDTPPGSSESSPEMTMLTSTLPLKQCLAAVVKLSAGVSRQHAERTLHLTADLLVSLNSRSTLFLFPFCYFFLQNQMMNRVSFNRFSARVNNFRLNSFNFVLGKERKERRKEGRIQGWHRQQPHAAVTCEEHLFPPRPPACSVAGRWQKQLYMYYIALHTRLYHTHTQPISN